MKTILALLVTVAAFNSYADEACKALSNYEGTYILASKTCDGPFGGDLTVEKSDSYSHTPYFITSGGIGIGPAITSNSADKCLIENESFTVQTCVYSACLPRGWKYIFSGNQVKFSAYNGCTAVFIKE